MWMLFTQNSNLRAHLPFYTEEYKATLVRPASSTVMNTMS